MNTRIGIWMGDSFAEMALAGAPQSRSAPQTSRWFHPKKSLAEGLREKIAELPAGTTGDIVIATSRAEMAVARKQGSEPALLITSGFETWARQGSSVRGTPSMTAAREWFPTSPEKIFGINERVQASGVVTRAFDPAELEALVSKFELMKIKDVAIAFLHGEKWPAHEREAAEVLRAKGFTVVCSHELPGAASMTDLARIRRTVESAFSEAVLKEDFAAIRSAAEGWTLSYWTPSGLGPSSAACVRGGVEASLARALANHDLAYFFGLEEFLGFVKGAHYLFSVQPTQQIGASSWPFPSWTGVDRGYEPGPMLLGKSHQLTFLDVLFVRDRLKGDIEGFSDRVQAKASARILETLFTLGKNLAEPGRRAADAKEIAEDLETMALETFAMDLAFKSASKVFVTGPLATTMVPLLERRRPDVKFTVDETVSIASSALGGLS